MEDMTPLNSEDGLRAMGRSLAGVRRYRRQTWPQVAMSQEVIMRQKEPSSYMLKAVVMTIPIRCNLGSWEAEDIHVSSSSLFSEYCLEERIEHRHKSATMVTLD